MKNILSERNYDQSKELVLIKEAVDGNKMSLNKFLKIHQDYIFNIAFKILNDQRDAEDATQEVLIKLVTSLSKYDPERAKVRTWIYKITFNHVLSVKKSPYEQSQITFSKFFDMLGGLPDIPIPDEEINIMGSTIEEARISCTSGMLMCLDRDERLTFIVGDLFRIDHNLASEIFEISPANFRKKLSRVRANLRSWIQGKCGLINTENPCRCRNKAKVFVQNGWVNPESMKWNSNYYHKISEFVTDNMEEMDNVYDRMVSTIYQDHPFKSNLAADTIYKEILSNKDFVKFTKL